MLHFPSDIITTHIIPKFDSFAAFSLLQTCRVFRSIFGDAIQKLTREMLKEKFKVDISKYTTKQLAVAKNLYSKNIYMVYIKNTAFVFDKNGDLCTFYPPKYDHMIDEHNDEELIFCKRWPHKHQLIDMCCINDTIYLLNSRGRLFYYMPTDHCAGDHPNPDLKLKCSKIPLRTKGKRFFHQGGRTLLSVDGPYAIGLYDINKVTGIYHYVYGDKYVPDNVEINDYWNEVLNAVSDNVCTLASISEDFIKNVEIDHMYPHDQAFVSILTKCGNILLHKLAYSEIGLVEIHDPIVSPLYVYKDLREDWYSKLYVFDIDGRVSVSMKSKKYKNLVLPL